MKRYPLEFKLKVRGLRAGGKTYGEINHMLEVKLPKSTLSELCKEVQLPTGYVKRIEQLNFRNIGKARAIALEMNKIKREEFFKGIDLVNNPIAEKIDDRNVAKIALAMLCLGEASKSRSSSAFYLGSSDPKIVLDFILLLKKSFNFDLEKIRCTVQCRADQDSRSLNDYWSEVTHIPKRLFYKPSIDLRTRGKPTNKSGYKGVLRIYYFDSKVRFELESLSELIYNHLTLGPW